MSQPSKTFQVGTLFFTGITSAIQLFTWRLTKGKQPASGKSSKRNLHFKLAYFNTFILITVEFKPSQ